MAAIRKTVLATGGTSGLGFEVIKQLLSQPSQPYRFILGARDLNRTQSAFSSIHYDSQKHSLKLLSLDLADLNSVKRFADEGLKEVGEEGLDYVFLNAGHFNHGKEPTVSKKYCNVEVVNHISQHYLLHLLRDKIVSSHSRVVIVSSGGIRMVKDPSTLHETLKKDSDADTWAIYGASKFTQLLGAHWWRRNLGKDAELVAVSPGMIPDTGLARHVETKLPHGPDSKTVPEGAQSLIAAFHAKSWPSPDHIFLTSWGEWWDPQEIFPLSLDEGLQGRWCVGREEIERDCGVN